MWSDTRKRSAAWRVAGVTVAAAVGFTASGCASDLKNRDMTVIFKDGTSRAELAAASKACAHVVPGITPVAEPSLTPQEQQLAGNSDEIRFHIGGADDHDVAQLTDCLNKQPGVIGVQPPDDDMS